MPRQIYINTHSTGKFKTEVINSRPHIVTEMVSIVGDSVMKGLLYENEEISNSYLQLDTLHAPAGHPVANGQQISAFHPLAINAFGVGGFVRSPRREGKKVINELLFDIQTAEKDERGKEIINRIKAGEAIGVSTGLDADVRIKSGKLGNVPYKGIVSNIRFDHVAILLNETPAGDETFTVTNNDLIICNLADSINDLREKVDAAVQAKFGSGDRHAWVRDVLFSPDRAIVEMQDKILSVPFGYNDAGDVVFTGEGVEVKHVWETIGDSATFHNQEVHKMDALQLVLAFIGNALNSCTMADKDHMIALSEADLVNFVHGKITPPEISVDQAQTVINAAGMTINAADFDKDAHALFLANQDGFKAYMAGKDAEKVGMIDKIIANSKMTKEQVEAMPLDSIISMADSLVPGQTYAAQGQPITNNDRSGGDTVIKLHAEA